MNVAGKSALVVGMALVGISASLRWRAPVCSQKRARG